MILYNDNAKCNIYKKENVVSSEIVPNQATHPKSAGHLLWYKPNEAM